VICDLIAPDYPGFGHSSWPNPKEFPYTFDSLAKVTQDFAKQLHLDRYTLFMQDYGGPVGFRMALAHPEKIQAMIIQNAVSHEEGLSPLWAVRRTFGRIEPLTKPKFEPICYHLRQQGRDTSEHLPTAHNTIPISGSMSITS
jgi:pimeloyl-ACP methyl ester carboxylesterase